MSDMNGLEYARLRLQEWGDYWAEQPAPGARGFGRSCLNDSVGSGSEECAVPVSVEEVDHILQSLPAIGMVDVRDALKIRYHDHCTFEAGAVHLSAKQGGRVSKDKFYRFCEQGEMFLLGRLGG